MHRYIAGTCTMHLTLTPQGPWMVRGETREEPFTDHRERRSLRDILWPIQNHQGSPVLPASSLKGVLRSTAECILRSMQPERSPALRPLADDPFVHPNEADLNRLERAAIADTELVEWNNRHRRYTSEIKPDQVYRILSPASQLFGCTLHAGLVTLEDACASERRTWRRSHVAIDRFTGGVGEGPFIEKLAAAETSLTTTLTITNFALWHIALMALVVQEISRGYVHVGGGTRKGQGQVQIAIPRLDISYARAAYNKSDNKPVGIISAQARLEDEPWHATDVPLDVVAAEGGITLLETLEPQSPRGWREESTVLFLVQEDQVEQLFREAVAKAWRAWIEQVKKEEEV